MVIFETWLKPPKPLNGSWFEAWDWGLKLSVFPQRLLLLLLFSEKVICVASISLVRPASLLGLPFLIVFLGLVVAGFLDSGSSSNSQGKTLI